MNIVADAAIIVLPYTGVSMKAFFRPYSLKYRMKTKKFMKIGQDVSKKFGYKS